MTSPGRQFHRPNTHCIKSYGAILEKDSKSQSLFVILPCNHLEGCSKNAYKRFKVVISLMNEVPKTFQSDDLFLKASLSFS